MEENKIQSAFTKNLALSAKANYLKEFSHNTRPSMRTSKLIFCTTFSDKFWERVIRRRRKEMGIPGGRIVSLVTIPGRRDEETERERWGGRERDGGEEGEKDRETETGLLF